MTTQLNEPTSNSSPAQAAEVAQSWLTTFQDACTNLSKDVSQPKTEAITDLFLRNGFWRDYLCLSWDFRTAEGIEQIHSLLSTKSALANAGIGNCALDLESGVGVPNFQPFPLEPSPILEFTFRFTLQSPPGSGRAVARLAQDQDQSWKAFVLLTSLESLKGHEENIERPLGHYEGHTRPWDTAYAQEVEKNESDPTVLVVGGGTSGLLAAIRLRKLGIRVLVIERNPRIGDNWRNRYDLLTLHTTFSHLRFPYQSFPENIPLYIPKTKFADFLDYYALFQEIPVWTSTSLVPQPTYDVTRRRWKVSVIKNGIKTDLSPKHLLVAIGIFSKPNIPRFPGSDLFSGEMFHSKAYKNASGWKGKKVVIIGMGVSASDIAQEAESRGADVLMVQRSPICYVSKATVRHHLDMIWPPSRPIDDSDLLSLATPSSLLMRLCRGVIVPMQEDSEKDVREGLLKKGVFLGQGEEVGLGSIGLFGLLTTRGGGFYVDVGCSERIIEGKIKVKSDVQVSGFDKTGIKFSDGERTDADIVVLGTGYSSMRSSAAELLGDELADTDIWGLDSEGELRGVCRPTGHPGLWYAAGAVNQSRHLSKYLALQILGEELEFVRR